MNAKTRTILALLFCLAAPSRLHAAATGDANWPQFRGSDPAGVSANPNLPDKWSATENVAWKTDLPGRSWSSPIVWGDRVFRTTNRGRHGAAVSRSQRGSTEYTRVYAV